MVWNFERRRGIAPTNANNKPGEQFVWIPRLYRDTLALKGIQPRSWGRFVGTRTSDQPARTPSSTAASRPAAAQIG